MPDQQKTELYSNQQSNNPHNNNRRKFIKYAGIFGTLFSGSTFSSSVKKITNKIQDNKKSSCNFNQLPNEFTYLNTGTEGSMPACVLNTLQQSQQRWATSPTNAYETDEILGKHQHVNREKIARFLAVKKNNIALTDNTTMGLSMVIMGLNFKASDKIITTNHEHNAIASPLSILQEKLGLTVHTQSFPSFTTLSKMSTKQIITALLPNNEKLRGAKALCISHVFPSTGIKLPLKALRKRTNELGIKYLIIDGAQAIGMVDISQGDNHITYADFYACPGHKWLNGPPSTGILYIKNSAIKPPEFYPVLSQRMGKYIKGSSTSSFPMTEALQVRGCSNTPGFAALVTAIEFGRNLGGYQFIEKHILTLSSQVKRFIIEQSANAIVSPYKDEQLTSGLTVFFPFSWNNPNKIYSDQKTADLVVKQLLKKSIQIRSIGFIDSIQGNEKVYALRVSTAIFNNEEHIEKFKSSLKEALLLI